MPYGLTYMGPQGEEEDPVAAAVRELMASLEPSPQTPAPQAPRPVGMGRNIIGSLGDALLSMAQVRAGGGPMAVGPFAAGQRERQKTYEERQMEYEKRMAENAAADRVMRNKARVDLALIGKRGQMVKPFRPQLKTFNTTDPASKRPVQVPYLFDPNTRTLQPVGGHESGFFQYVRPFLAQGVNQDTGELEFRLLDPFAGQGEEMSGGGAIEGFEPKPTAGEAESVEAASVIKQQLADFKSKSQSYSGKERAFGTIRSLGQNVVRELPGGQAVSETLGDPAFEELAALRGRIGQQLARLVESGRLSDQDRDFALENLPTVPSLTTESGRKTAASKIALVEKEIELRLTRKARLRPGLTGAGRAKPERSGQFTGRTLPASSFDRLPPETREAEKQRFIDGGGTVIEGQ